MSEHDDGKEVQEYRVEVEFIVPCDYFVCGICNRNYALINSSEQVAQVLDPTWELVKIFTLLTDDEQPYCHMFCEACRAQDEQYDQKVQGLIMKWLKEQERDDDSIKFVCIQDRKPIGWGSKSPEAEGERARAGIEVPPCQ